MSRSLFFRITATGRTRIEAVVCDFDTARREGLIRMEELALRGELTHSDFASVAMEAAVAEIEAGGADMWDPTNVSVYWPSVRGVPPYRWGDLANIVGIVSMALAGRGGGASKAYDASLECLSTLGRAYAALHDTLGGIDSGTGMMYSTYMANRQWLAFSSGMNSNSFVRNVNQCRDREARGQGTAWAI
jgi:hypothetical protein